MLNVSNGLKIAAVLAFAGLGAATLRPAHADTYGTRCDSDSNRCFAVRCDDDGNLCTRVSSDRDYDRSYTRTYQYRTRYICDAYGEDCRWERYRVYDDDAY